MVCQLAGYTRDAGNKVKTDLRRDVPLLLPRRGAGQHDGRGVDVVAFIPRNSQMNAVVRPGLDVGVAITELDLAVLFLRPARAGIGILSTMKKT